jgi:hypothetical protein
MLAVPQKGENSPVLALWILAGFRGAVVFRTRFLRVAHRFCATGAGRLCT